MHAVQSHEETTPGARRPWLAPVALGTALTAGTVAVAALDPSDTGVPVCVSRSVFGIDCPLCGGLRCVNALARGDVLGAADHNVVLAVALPLLTLAWVAWLVTTLRGGTVRLPKAPTAAWVALGVLLVAFTVGRNLGVEGGEWLGWLAASATN